MLVLVRPDGLQLRPSALAYTPRSVPATLKASANEKTRTERPSRPFTAAHVNPPSLLANAPAPRVPASTNPALIGLKARVRIAADPPCTSFHVDPPSEVLTNKPSDVPT